MRASGLLGWGKVPGEGGRGSDNKGTPAAGVQLVSLEYYKTDQVLKLFDAVIEVNSFTVY